MADLIASAALLLFLVLFVAWLARYRARPWNIYDPKLAWLRAGLYFCACWLISYLTGAMELLLASPVFTSAQLANPGWRWFTAGMYAFILLAYPGVWVYFTVLFQRQRNTLVSGLFGLVWGASTGQLFLSVWLVAGKLGLPAWGTWLVTFVVLALHQPNWHSIYWDHYVAPEHDTPLTQKIKALGCHVPNLAISLTHLALYGNYAIFVSVQVIACTAAAIGMRFPAPWDQPSAMNLAPRSKGWPPRCTGYVPDDPLTDPYTPFYPGWRGPGR